MNKTYSKFYLNLSLLISFIPALLISGPFFSDLIVSCSSIFFLFYLFKKKEITYLNKKPIIFFFLFCVYCIFLSVFVSQDIFLSFQSSLFYFRIGIFSCLIWFLIENNKKILDYFYYTLMACFITLLIDGNIQYYFGKNLFGFEKYGPRISSFFGDEHIMGSYIARLYPLTFALFFLRKEVKTKLYLTILLFILFSSLIIISGERTAIVFHIISIIFIIVLTKKYFKLKLFIFFSFIAFFILIISYSEIHKNRFLKNPISGMGLTNAKEDKYIFTKAHDSLYKTAINMFLDKPVFGHGPKMFRVICKDEKYATGITPCMTHPHNFYVQLLAETGIVGFLFLLSALMYVVYCALRQLKTILFKEQRYLTDYQVCLLACLLITVWPLSPNGNFFNNWLMICYSLPVGFYLHSIYGKNRKEVLKE